MTTNALDALLARVDDPALRDALSNEVERLRSTKDFGLVFEKHLPESVRLYTHPVKRGLKVQLRSGSDQTTRLVRRVRNGEATLLDSHGVETTVPVDDLVVVREFGEPIYPGLTSVGRIERGGDKPFHTVLNAENYHALQTLLYLYEGQVDCIYIDPPYNTGARDWKYDNDFVDAEDAYRHSKWLAFMERRLLLAKRLLNPDDSVLIVTIDEKEYLRLGLLLEQVFSSCTIQMASIVTNPSGSVRPGRLTRTDEYAYFVFVGSAVLTPQYVEGVGKSATGPIPKVWETAVRSGSGTGIRQSRPNLFYPVFVTEGSLSFHSVGAPLKLESDRFGVPVPEGCVAIWPLGREGREQTWGFSDDKMRQFFSNGSARISRGKRGPSVLYMQTGVLEKIENGTFKVVGRNDDGSLQLGWGDSTSGRPEYPRTTWSTPSHSASSGGTRLLSSLLPDRVFPYPKSLYAVEDSMRYVVAEKPNAVVLDFFGGSGTTAHAVMRLNRQDGGRRQAIIVTNNEVSVEEAAGLTKRGFRSGDPEWEALGIFRHVTRPRIEAATTGQHPNGTPIVGNYRFVDEFPMAMGFEENFEFLELTYLDPNDVSRGKSFEAIGHLLWMKAGATGAVITKEERPFSAPADARYAILFDVDHWQGFAEAVRERADLVHIYVVTDSMASYQQIIAELPATVETSMLYEDYVRNFEINGGGTL